jgi:hypothetical protein
MKLYKATSFLLIAVALSACKPEIESFEPTAGNANFTKYVALGNSLTSGYRDGDLFISGQMNSYPNIIAAQLKLAGGGEFTQPLMYDDLGFGNKLVLNLNMVRDCYGNPAVGALPSLGPVQLKKIDPTLPDPRNFTRREELFNSSNLGVPGAKSFHLIFPSYGMLNPYFTRFSKDPMSVSVVEQALLQNPTFFTLWIGNNDVLSYALTGGQQDSITSTALFSFAYSTIIGALTQGGAKGVVANIPDITNIAYFNTIPYNGLVLQDQIQVDGLNAGYSALGITFGLGPNPFIVQDPSAPGGLRQIKSNELLLLSLPQDSIKCAGWGSLKPIPAYYYLSEAKINEIKTATLAFNNIIAQVAEANGVALVDANSIFSNIRSGLVYDGVKYGASYITGGVNSLDGIHLTPRGNAIVANFFIDAINSKYQANVPKVDVNDYPGLLFP